ncbi:NUDIX hydrolase [Polaromonas sp.]|nr:NUDIX hydrolase [Candidatus Saccharibacteria bacterium]
MNEQNYYRISIKGIVIDADGRILLSREDNGKWEMLGGGLDHNEDPIDCLSREVREETGLEVTYVSKAPLYFVTSKREGKDTYLANVIYEIKLKNMDFTPSDECQELRFFSLQEMHEVDLFANVKKLLDLLEQ